MPIGGSVSLVPLTLGPQGWWRASIRECCGAVGSSQPGTAKGGNETCDRFGENQKVFEITPHIAGSKKQGKVRTTHFAVHWSYLLCAFSPLSLR